MKVLIFAVLMFCSNAAFACNGKCMAIGCYAVSINNGLEIISKASKPDMLYENYGGILEIASKSVDFCNKAMGIKGIDDGLYQEFISILIDINDKNKELFIRANPFRHQKTYQIDWDEKLKRLEGFDFIAIQ